LPADTRLVADLRDLHRPSPQVAESLARVWGRVAQQSREASPRLRSGEPRALPAVRDERRGAMNRYVFAQWRERLTSQVSILVATLLLVGVVTGWWVACCCCIGAPPRRRAAQRGALRWWCRRRVT
jgi:hypothetical protein